MAEGERDAANMAAATAADAQATAEAARDAANMTAAAAADAQATAEAARDDANMAAAAAADAQATAEAARDDANMAAAAAADAQGLAEGERDLANTAAEEAAAAQMTAEDERDAANMAAEAAVERAETAEAELADVKVKAADVLAKLAADEATAMAKAVLAAIAVNTRLEVGANPMAPVVNLTASSAGTLTAEQTGYTTSDTGADHIPEFRGAVLENDDGDMTVIYTNIENAVAKSLSGVYAASSDPGEPAVYSVVAEVGEDDHDIPWADAKRTDANSAITGAGDTQVTKFSGTVRGVPGTFSCTETCTPPVPEANTGALTSDETWAFAPTDPFATVDVEDTAYVSFGWWLKAALGGTGYEFDAFTSTAAGMMPNSGRGDALEGSATYKGGAAGKWAMVSTTDDRAEGGHFTARATLVANFDADSDGVLTPNEAREVDGVSIRGTIDNFVTGGDTSRDTWKVTLMPVDTDTIDGLQTPTQVVPITAGVTEWTTGGALKGAGSWTANFYGTEAETNHPMAATGEFDAAIGGGEVARVSGAFAATK